MKNISIARFENTMVIAGVNYNDLNNEFGLDVKSELLNGNSEILEKSCIYLGLTDSKYITMETNSCNFIGDDFYDNRNAFPIKFINFKELDSIVNRSKWNWPTLAILTHKPYLKHVLACASMKQKYIKIEILDTICYALKCDIRDICKVKITKKYLHNRVLMKNDRYLLNKEYFDSLSDNEWGILENKCKIPRWFLQEDNNYISYEMLFRIYNNVNKIRNLSINDLHYGSVIPEVVDQQVVDVSISRLNNLLFKRHINWDTINSVFPNMEKTVKNKLCTKNDVHKLVSLIGIEDSDYICMLSDNYRLLTVDEMFEKDFVYSSILDINKINERYKISTWNWMNISHLMDSKSILRFGATYLRTQSTVTMANLNNLCYALKCDIGDICIYGGGSKQSKRINNSRDMYLLNVNVFNQLSDDDWAKFEQKSRIPRWFLEESNNYISYELLLTIYKSFIKIGRKISIQSLVMNFEDLQKNEDAIFVNHQTTSMSNVVDDEDAGSEEGGDNETVPAGDEDTETEEPSGDYEQVVEYETSTDNDVEEAVIEETVTVKSLFESAKDLNDDDLNSLINALTALEDYRRRLKEIF